MTENDPPPAGGKTPPRPDLPEAARRALEEAEARRAAADAEKAKQKEVNGPKGHDPVRYGDWENKGICSDF
jgi:hypothetical protein